MYALGLVLTAARQGGVDLERAAAETDEPLPMAPLFMAWWLTREPKMRITADGQGWAWHREGA
jgi:hypothetical protein